MVWEYEPEAAQSTAVRQSAVDRHVLYTAWGRRLQAVTPDKEILWDTELPVDCTALIIIPDGIFCLFENGKTAAYDFSGTELWQGEGAGFSSYPAAGDNGIYILRGEKLSLMDFSGKIVSDTEPGELTMMQPVLGDDLLVCGTREWVACAFKAESTLMAGWTQKGGGASHSGASGEKKWYFNDKAYRANMDYLYLREFIYSGSQQEKLDALDEIKQRIAADGIDRGENYLLHLVHLALTEEQISRAFPAVRAKAADILGVYGTFESVELLVSALGEEQQSYVSTSIISALGRLGTDYRGLASRAIYDKIIRDNNKMYDRLVLAGIEAVEKILSYGGVSESGYGYRVLIGIMRGGYSTVLRRKAVEVLRSIK